MVEHSQALLEILLVSNQHYEKETFKTLNDIYQNKEDLMLRKRLIDYNNKEEMLE